MRFTRALLAFLALPGLVGGLVPWLLWRSDPWRASGTWIGTPVAAAGLAVVLWCVRDFYAIGKGTLAPWDPPRRLVIVGLYRWVRNPMYVGVLLWVTGCGLWAGSPLLLMYVVGLAAAFHLRVRFYEEPTLSGQFEEDWREYCRTVPRWWPRRRG